jgi:hypothetical protein
VAGRVLKISTTFRRSVEKLGVAVGSSAYQAVSRTMRALAAAQVPGVGDYESSFTPGRAHVRRVPGHNLWLLYRFDDDHVFIMAARAQPPVPIDE